ncbi:MAG: hypothetical protein H6576_04570 [Lewinellaceae bacterium]|nr:hypothetical protein [Lewinellaceae bacterium]
MKIKTTKFLITLPLIIFLLACKRDPAITTVSGVVTEYGTGKPISNVEVFVLCNTSDPFGPQLPGNLVDTMFTDAQGRFYREYPEKDFCLAAYLAFYKPGYYVHNDVDISTGENYFEVVLDAEAWFKLVTVPDLGIWQSLGFGGSVSPHSVAAIYGTEEQVFSYPGRRNLVLHWGPFSNPDESSSDTIFIVPHDTTTYTIHY